MQPYVLSTIHCCQVFCLLSYRLEARDQGDFRGHRNTGIDCIEGAHRAEPGPPTMRFLLQGSGFLCDP